MSYGIDNITKLSIRDAVRLRVPMYLGSDDTNGIYQAFKEIVNNATDEANIGYGNEIKIFVDEKENCIEVRDYGRGVPFGIRENGENVLVSIYTETHTGGKFDKKSYKTSSGLNGVGGSATCLSSEYFIVESHREGKYAIAKFKEGLLEEYKENVNANKHEKDGTYIKFKPDKKVFKNMTENFSYAKICEDIENISYLNKKIKFVVHNVNTGESETYLSKRGIIDFVESKSTNGITKPIIGKASDDIDSVEIAMMWTNDKDIKEYVFVNGLYCPEGGTPLTGARTTLTTQMKSLSKKNLTPESIRKGLVIAINCIVDEPSFANQTKTKISNRSLRTLANQILKSMLIDFSKTSDFNKMIKIIEKTDKAEQAAENARKQILETTKKIEKSLKKKVINTDKLKDAEYTGKDSILLVVEGDSAAGGMANARDHKKYGILGLRGKMINCLSKSEEQIMDNNEIQLLLQALGIVPGKYNPNKLRYGKLAICTDADSDGYHIGLLVMSALAYFAPEFITEERLCWLRSPLYIVKNGKKESYYFSDSEFEKAKDKIKGTVSRAKGLGALSDEQAHNSMFTDEYQRMDILKPDDETFVLLRSLMGDDIEYRKNYIFKNVDFKEIKE